MPLTFIAQVTVYDGLRTVEAGEEFEIPDGHGFPPETVAIPKDKKAAAAAKKALDKASANAAPDEHAAPSTPAEAAVVAAAAASQSSQNVI